MRLEVLGSDGSKLQGSSLCSILLGDSVLLDAGSASNLSRDQQLSVEMVLLTHAHLDHILELGFLLDATVALRNEPLVVTGSQACLEMVRMHYLNDLVWPDFSGIRIAAGPALVYRPLPDREWLPLPGGLEAWMEPVCHGAGARGFLFRTGTGSAVYTGDTGPTETLWERASELADLRMVIAEVSFPDTQENRAIASNHLTPGLLERELRKLGRDGIPLYAFHLKPWLRSEIEGDLQRRFGERLTVLDRGTGLEL
jgi:ribonuclease BN (tRNA processing enzyme)